VSCHGSEAKISSKVAVGTSKPIISTLIRLQFGPRQLTAKLIS
jgi:hypothetical protein